MASKLTTSNRAGWAFAIPGFGLIAIFIVLPFFFAFYFSLTNQRLVSPNATEWVGLQNYRELLNVGILTLEPERDDAGEVVRDDDGRDRISARPYLHAVGRLSAVRGDAGVVLVAVGRQPQGRPGERRRLHEGADEHLPLRARRGAGAGDARALPGLAHQPEAPGHKRFPGDLLHARRGLDRRRVAALAVHLRRQQRPSEQHPRLAHFRRVDPGRLARQSGDRAAGDHGDVDLAGRRLSHGDLARGPADDQPDALRGGRHRGRVVRGSGSDT